MALPGFNRPFSKYPAWFKRLAVGSESAAAPPKAHFHLTPSAEPTAGTKGDVYIDDADGAMYVHNGTDWQQVTYVV